MEFSPERAERNIRFIEQHCFIPDGAKVGQRVRLTEKQKQWMHEIYGTPTRTYILSLPRKNAKTAFVAFLLLLHLCGPEGVKNGQLYSAAQSRDQAAVIYGYASKIVRMSPSLDRFVTCKDTTKELACKELGTVYKALSSEASTAYGLSPVFIVHDELGQVRGENSPLYDALETASAAHESPLSLVISTQAATDGDLLSMLIDDAQANTDPTIKCTLYAAPVDADPFSPETLALANPHWHEFMNQQEVLGTAQKAQRMPSMEPSYRNLHLNQRIEAKSPFVSKSVWDENSGVPESIAGKRVWVGLDLSQTRDLTAMVVVSEDGDVECQFWLPAEGLPEKSRADRVPYDRWARDGLLEATPGRSVDYSFVAQRIVELYDRCEVVTLAFDRYNMRFLTPDVERAGLPAQVIEDTFKEYGQGYISMSPALRELETLLLDSGLRHGGHPVLSMCAGNAVVTEDAAGNRKLDKSKASGRIDGMVALAMAVGVRGSTQVAKKEDFFFHIF